MEHIDNIPNRILKLGLAALAQANTQAVYFDPGVEETDALSVINAVLAGELIIKAVIAKQQPLLIFKNLFQLGPADTEEITVERLLRSGKTYTFGELPNLLWTCTGNQISDYEVFREIQNVRNSLTHFCRPDHTNLNLLSLNFIYGEIEPLLYDHFDYCAIEHHNDTSVDYSYVVNCLIHNEVLFIVPKGFRTSEINIEDELNSAPSKYADEMRRRIKLAAI